MLNPGCRMEDFVKNYAKVCGGLPSMEGKNLFASNSEIRRWFLNGSIEVNGKKVTRDTEWPALADRVVIHPKSRKRRTTLQ